MDNEILLSLCKNCGNGFEENFCNRCGQKKVHRITLPHVVHDILHVFLHANKGIFTYIARLIYQPGYLALEYINGKRKIFNPFQYLLFSIAFVIFIMTQSDFYEGLQKINVERAAVLPSYFQTAMIDFTGFIKKYANAIFIATLPVYALFSWLFFKKRKENYAEHFTIMVFSISQVNTLNAVVLMAMIFAKVTVQTSALYSMLLILVCFTIAYKQFYALNWLKAFWKSFLIYATAYLVQVIIMSIGLLVYIIILSRK